MSEPLIVHHGKVRTSVIKVEKVHEAKLEKHENPKGSCCGNTLACLLTSLVNSCICCVACSCSAEGFVGLHTNVLLKALEDRKNWRHEIVPIPLDHQEKLYNHEVAHYFRLDPNLLAHADVGSSLGWKGVGFHAIYHSLVHWPEDVGYNWKSREQCERILFAEKEKFPFPEKVPDLKTIEGMTWLFTNSVGFLMLRKVITEEEKLKEEKKRKIRAEKLKKEKEKKS